MVLEFALLIFCIISIIAFGAFYEKGDMPYLITSSICAALTAGMTAVSFSAIRKIKRGENFLAKSFLIKTGLAWGMFCSVFLSDLEYIFVGLFLLALGITVSLSIYYALKQQKTSQNKSEQAFALPKHFSADKAKWSWDSAAEEYCLIHRKTPEQIKDLTPEENDRIYDYAGGHIAYFLAWIIRHDFYSEEFANDFHEDIPNIKNGMGNPVEILRCLDYVLTEEELCSNIIPFMDDYYETFSSNRIRYNIRYWDDYLFAVQGKDKLFYCMDFSWDKYFKLERLIDERYRYFLIDCEMQNDLYDYEEMFFKPFGEYIGIYRGDDVSDEYYNRCINKLNDFSGNFKSRLIDSLIEFCQNYDEFDESAIQKDKENILALFHISEIYILNPWGKEEAFVISGECDLEEEHGFAVTIREDEILEAIYWGEYSSPWCEDNEIIYQTAKECRLADVRQISSIECAEEKAKEGLLKKVQNVPGIFPEKNHTESVYLPPCSAKIKEKLDATAENWFRQNIIDDYVCTPKFADGKIIPQMLNLQCLKDGEIVFFDYIHIWWD